MNWMNFFEEICRCLNESGTNYCLLRMPTEDVEDVCPGDVDLLVDGNDLGLFYDLLADNFDLEQLSFIQTHAQIPVRERESGLSLKLDIHAKLYVGMSGGLFPFPIEDAVLASSTLHGDIPRPAFEYEYTLLMLHTLVDKSSIREARLHHLFSLFEAAQTHQASILKLWEDALGAKLTDFLWRALAREDTDGLKTLRRAILRHFWLKAPVESTGHFVSSQIRARSYLWNWPLIKPFTVAIVGPDGVGKSTLGRTMAENPGVSYRYFGNQGTFLPTTKLIYKVWNSKQGKSVSRSMTQNDGGEKKRSRPKQRSWKDKLKDVSSRPLLQWHHAAEMGARYLSEIIDSDQNIIIFDRYVYDMCIDQLQGGSEPSWKRALIKFYLDYFPRPDMLVMLVADPELIYQRKQEKTPTQLRDYMDSYRELVRLYKFDDKMLAVEEFQTEKSEAETVDRLRNLIEKVRLTRIATAY